jgi:hypothetical protein
MANRVGGEVDGFCTKCRMILAHTILAMVGERIARVKCNTCGGEHAYKAAEPGTAAPRSSTPRASKPRAEGGTRTRAQEASFEEQLAGKDLATARPYAVGEKFAVGDLVNHPTFGIGLVGAARPDKIDVTFKSFVKTLLHSRPGGPSKPPSFARPPVARPVDAAEEPVPEGAAPQDETTV